MNYEGPDWQEFQKGKPYWIQLSKKLFKNSPQMINMHFYIERTH